MYSLLLWCILIHYQGGYAYFWQKPNEYCSASTKNDSQQGSCISDIKMYASPLVSSRSLITYEYKKFEFCYNSDEHNTQSKNFGQAIFGEDIQEIPYKFVFKQDVLCKEVCTKEYHMGDNEDMKKIEFLKKAIDLNYEHRFMFDNMPVTWCYDTIDQVYCATNFPIGCKVTEQGRQKDTCVISGDFNMPGAYYVFNHLDIEVAYIYSASGQEPTGSVRFVRAKVQMKSQSSCDDSRVLGIYKGQSEKLVIPYTYSVRFVLNNNIKWSSRWDYVLDNVHYRNIQWFSIFNSIIVVFFLSAILVLTILKTVYNISIKCCKTKSLPEIEDRWKYISGHVFKSPSHVMLLSAFLGNGVQMIGVTFITTILSAFRVISVLNLGSVPMTRFLSWSCLSFTAGYVSARFYKRFGEQDMKHRILTVILTIILCPCFVAPVYLVKWIINDAKGGCDVLSIDTLIMVGLWIAIALPLTSFGAIMGFWRSVTTTHVKVDPEHKAIPKAHWIRGPVPTMIMGGILPFGCVFIQCFFIFNSIIFQQIYTLYSFFVIVLILMVLTVSSVTICLCYFQLNVENYNWWWRSILNGGFTAVYIFIYSIHYFVTKTEIKEADSIVLYFSEVMLICFGVFLVTGTVGFFSCFLFVSKIYSTLKTVNDKEVEITM